MYKLINFTIYTSLDHISYISLSGFIMAIFYPLEVSTVMLSSGLASQASSQAKPMIVDTYGDITMYRQRNRPVQKSSTTTVRKYGKVPIVQRVRSSWPMFGNPYSILQINTKPSIADQQPTYSTNSSYKATTIRNMRSYEIHRINSAEKVCRMSDPFFVYLLMLLDLKFPSSDFQPFFVEEAPDGE